MRNSFQAFKDGVTQKNLSHFFPAWLTAKNYDLKFEYLAEEKLSSLLREFFASVRTKLGKPYSKSGMVNLRSGLNRHLQSPPYNRNINLMKDSTFSTANQVFTGQVKKIEVEGPSSESHTPITQADIDQIHYKYFLPYIDTPETLQHKVFFDLMLYMKKMGRTMLRDLKKEMFYVGVRADGTEFVKMLPDSSAVRLEQNELKYIYDRDNCILAQGGPRCPVVSFVKYLSLLHPLCEWFFQRPNPQHANVNSNKYGIWYLSTPLGKNALAVFMKEISKRAGLQMVYTNSSIKA